MKDHYYKTKLRKMGKWALLPADSGSWHGLKSSVEFKKVFGFGKGLLLIHTLADGYQYAYSPVSYFEKLARYLDSLKVDDYRG